MKIRKERKRIAINVPAGDTVHTGFMVCLHEMVGYTLQHMGKQGLEFKLNCMSTSMLPWSRHELARVSLIQNATHQLWIDSDMQFAPDMLLRFMRHDEPIVGINAMSRRPPHRCTAQHADGSQVETTIESSGTEKVSRTGFGIIWIASDVFRAIDLPWFQFEWLMEQKMFRGEDYYFLDKAKRSGFEVVIDHDISKGVTHVGSFAYTPLLKEKEREA